MADHSAGEAKLSIVPDISAFKKRLDADMKRIDAEFKLPVRPELTKATADIDRWIAEQSRKDVHVGVEVDTRKASAAAKSLEADFSKVFSALKFNAGALGIGSLPALATALVTVAGSVQQLSQAGLALPGVFAGIGASVSTAALGMSGMSDALKAVDKASDGTAKSVQAASDALAKLSPNAAGVVKEIAGLKPVFQDLRNTVSQNLFAGTSDDIKKLVDADLPHLKSGFAGVATSLNQNIKQLGVSLSSGTTTGLLDRIFGNTADAQGRLTKAIDPIVHALGTLSAAGSDTLPRLADGVGKLADRFDQFITAADSDGRLDKWINDGITGVGHLGDTLLNIGKSFTAITKAAGGGEGLLGALDQGSEKLSTFLNSAQGQDTLKKFFQEGRDTLEKWLPILQNLAGLLPGLIDGARQWTDVLLPPLKAVTDVLTSMPGLVPPIVTAFLAWKSIDGVASLLGNLSKVAEALGLLPAEATTAATGISGALAGITLPAWLAAGDLGALLFQESHARADDQASGRTAEVPIGPRGLPVGVKPSGPIPGGGDANAQRQRRGLDPIYSGGGGHFAKGGVLPGYSPGTDNLLGMVNGRVVGLSGGEGILTPDVVKKNPGLVQALNDGNINPGWKIDTSHASVAPPWDPNRVTAGRLGDIFGGLIDAPSEHTPGGGMFAGFATGGVVDQYGNPVTPGGAPGPIAPNPTGGGVGDIFGKVLGGIQGPIGNAISLGQGLAGGGGGNTGSFADRASQIPGLIGLAGSLGSSNPGTALTNWGASTAQWLGNFTAKTVGGFGSALWQGALGLVGLDNSILSPNNPWNQAGQQVGQFALGQNGPLGTLLGTNSNSGSSSSDSSSTATAPSTSSSASSSAAYAQGSTPAGSGAARWRPAVRAALASVGAKYGITNTKAWEDAIIGQINFESKGNPNALNPKDSDGLPAIGLGQFKAATFAAHNITGGDIHDGNAQIYAMIDYVSSRYGQNSAGVPNGINQGHGYSSGGGVNGPGGPTTDSIPAMLSTGEHVFTAADVQAMGGQQNVMAFRHALHMAEGGPPVWTPEQQAAFAKAQAASQPSRPSFNPGPGARYINAPSPSGRIAPSGPSASAAPPVTASAPTAPQTPPTVAPAAPQGPGAAFGGGAPIAPGPTDLNHNLAAINTGIASGASAIGNLASAAISSAGGGLGIPGAGALGQFVSGLVQEGGKVLTDVVNVGSSFLVGDVPGSFGDPNLSAGGALLRPAQNIPQTAQDNRRTYNINGIDGRNLMDQLELQQKQDTQAQLAHL